MGNCFRRAASEKYWAGEDWGFLATQDENGKLSEQPKTEEKTLLVDEEEGCSLANSSLSSSSLPSAVTEVKIKITKKQLEELLGKVDINELSVHEVLARLMDTGDRLDKSYHRPWSPGLQSIPEAI